MQLLEKILVTWMVIGAIPLLWDFHKALRESLFNALIFTALYTTLGPVSWLLSLVVNFTNVG